MTYTNEQLKTFLGVTFYMSLFPIKFVRRYWSPRSRIGIVADKIALADFLDIKKHLHFVDNTKLGTGKLRKVQPIIDRFNVVSRSIEPEEYCSIDENTLPYKGKRSTLRQYNPKKPKKWGCKVYLLCIGKFGIILNSDVYCGKNSPYAEDKYPSLSKSSRVVAFMSEPLQKNVNHKIAFDNWFCTLQLMKHLQDQGIQAVATFQPNRFPNTNFQSDNELKKQGRGSSEEKQMMNGDDPIVAVKWFDNRSVHLVSTFCGVTPSTKFFDGMVC